MRAELTKLQGLMALSMVMTDSADIAHIVRLASSAVPSLAPAQCDGAFVRGRGWLEAAGPCLQRKVRNATEKQLRGLRGIGGRIEIEHEAWAWAFPMRNLQGAVGHLLVAGKAPVQESDHYLLGVLAQQLAIAIANADGHARERATAEELRVVNNRLERNLAIHDRLTEVAVRGGGMAAIAEGVHELTSYPVEVEDAHGNLVAWAGSGPPSPLSRIRNQRAELSELARHYPAPVRLDDRIAVLVGGQHDVRAVLALVDPANSAGDDERMALAHGATVIALELSRIQSVMEAESRVGRDLLEELLGGIDDERARIRAQVLGYDLGQPQKVAIVESATPRDEDRMYDAVRWAAKNVGAQVLLASRRGAVVVLAEADLQWASFQRAIDSELGHAGCRVGVGASWEHASDAPRSYREAQLALRLPHGYAGEVAVTAYDELGVFQIFAEAEDPTTVDRFVRTWLGPLLDYDKRRGSDLVSTLSAYLECSGSHARAADALTIHRNTLRYRIKRIEALSGHDLGAPDVQFNLQLATRAWRTLVELPTREGRGVGS